MLIVSFTFICLYTTMCIQDPSLEEPALLKYILISKSIHTDNHLANMILKKIKK
jgi:hypothetical protein